MRCCIKTLRLTSSVKKLPSYTVELAELSDDGLTLLMILLSLVSPGKQMKKRGIGNRSYIMSCASTTGASSKSFKCA